MPAPRRAWRFEIIMHESFTVAAEGLAILVDGYIKYAEDRGFPTKQDVESFAQARGQAETLLVRAVRKIGEATEELNSISGEIQTELDRVSPPLSDEQRYLVEVNGVIDGYYNHRKEFNSGLERIGQQVRSARTNDEHRFALGQGVAHLKASHRWFREDRDRFLRIMPLSRFREFHLLMTSVLTDTVEATNAYITYYSQTLNQGVQDIALANHASTLLKKANDNRLRAGYMYADLIERK